MKGHFLWNTCIQVSCEDTFHSTFLQCPHFREKSGKIVKNIPCRVKSGNLNTALRGGMGPFFHISSSRHNYQLYGVYAGKSIS